ncbi:hypothetical protein [Chryseobacterium shigense]|uniref:Uncharacterized protein n=1 Tax=Chryseobacterium shigense TaxID=297244 RepID=A0A841N3S6_9FLAO|nr:hypothetical protein [Chryseobacterium shigense]MBB6371097.1 hypothetical protein [Chryseobacterium shigense]
MNNLNEKLAKFSIEKLEERKEFTFYCNPAPCEPKPCNPKPTCGGTTPTDPGTTNPGTFR